MFFNTITGLPLTTTDANSLETRIEYDEATLRPLNVKTFYNNGQVGTTAETIYHDEPNNYWVKTVRRLIRRIGRKVFLIMMDSVEFKESENISFLTPSF